MITNGSSAVICLPTVLDCALGFSCSCRVGVVWVSAKAVVAIAKLAAIPISIFLMGISFFDVDPPDEPEGMGGIHLPSITSPLKNKPTRL